MHGFVYFDSVFDGVLGCFDEAGLGLVAGLVIIFFAQVAQLADGDSLFLYSFFPDF